MLDAYAMADFAGGAHLLDQASELDTNVALDLKDVRFGSSGEIRRRGGQEAVGSVVFTNDIVSMWNSGAGSTDHILCGDGANLRAITPSGTEDATASRPSSTSGRYGFANYGAPGTERTYCANATHLVYWDGTAWTTNPTVTVDGTGALQCPRPVALAVTPWDNRLMACGFDATGDGPNGAGGSPSTVFFSEAGDPAVWKSTWREHLLPGDGEDIVAAVAWRDYVFVFKQSKFFVFTSTTDAGGGVPRFNWYSVQANCGAMSPLGVCAARDGVYFIDRKGVYRTQGEEPELVSWRLDPLFLGMTPPFYGQGRPDMASIESSTICTVGEQVFVNWPTSGGWMSWVYDPRYDWWAYDSQPRACGTQARSGGQDQLFFAKKGVKTIKRHADSIANDDGSNITGLWRSSWMTLGGETEKILQRMRLWGAGTIAVSAATDFGNPGGGQQINFSTGGGTWADGTNAADKWGDGTNPADLWGGGSGYTDAWVDYAWKGKVFSIQFTGVNGSNFSIQRVEHHVSTPRRVAHDSKANA